MTSRSGGNSSLPIWLLDVDGVLNAICHPDRPPKTWDRWQRGTAGAGGERFVITFAPDLMAAIRELHDSAVVEIRWLTTWAYDANRGLRELLDLPEFPVAGEPERASAWWKLPYAVRTVEEGRPVIWTDDDLDYSGAARDWAADVGILAIAPHPAVGLTPADLNTIRAFCLSAPRG